MNLKAAKYLTAAMLAGMMVSGCSTPKNVEDSAAVQSQAQADAQASIDAAEASLAEARAMGNEWRDTEALLADAKAAMAAGDYAKAKELADQAKAQADNALNQYYLEKARLLHKELSARPGLTDAQKASLAEGLEIIKSGEGKKAWDFMSRLEAEFGAAMMVYSVVKGDNLWNIAAKDSVYGNAYQWPLIYKQNSAKIKDADLIFPGQQLDVNKAPSQADIDAAVNHAKTRGAWSVGATEASDSAYLSK